MAVLMKRAVTRSPLRALVTTFILVLILFFLLRRKSSNSSTSSKTSRFGKSNIIKPTIHKELPKREEEWKDRRAIDDRVKQDPDHPLRNPPKKWGDSEPKRPNDQGNGGAWPMKGKDWGKKPIVPLPQKVQQRPPPPLEGRGSVPKVNARGGPPGISNQGDGKATGGDGRGINIGGGAGVAGPVPPYARDVPPPAGVQPGLPKPGAKPKKKPMMVNAMNRKDKSKKLGLGPREEAILNDEASLTRLEEEKQARSFLAHPLVAKFATGNLRISTGSEPPKKYNLTVCALISGENRFLREWLVYHKLLGVDQVLLYDSARSPDTDSISDYVSLDSDSETNDGSILDLKRRMGTGLEALDEPGNTLRDRIQGLEKWIEAGAVKYHYVKSRHPSDYGGLQDRILEHCASTYSRSTNWLMHLGVNEFIVVADPLYGSRMPYHSPKTGENDDDKAQTWRFPLVDFLHRQMIKDSACLAIPRLHYRNHGIHSLAEDHTVLESQTKRDTLRHVRQIERERPILHPAFSRDLVIFAGSHSCQVSSLMGGGGLHTKSAQGEVLHDEDGDVDFAVELPTEPLAIAHFAQRDLGDCIRKLSYLDDEESIREKGRSAILCETDYMPTTEEVESSAFMKNPLHKYLKRTPEEGSVVDDQRLAQSWTARAAKVVLGEWRKRGDVPPSETVIKEAASKAMVLTL